MAGSWIERQLSEEKMPVLLHQRGEWASEVTLQDVSSCLLLSYQDALVTCFA